MSDTDQTRSNSPFDPPSGDANGAPSAYAIESRAETIRVTSAGDAMRRGETNEVHAGEVTGFHDAVDGPERTTVAGLLRERSHDLQLSAVRSETTIGGRMSIRAGKEDSVILGGAMTDTWTGGTLIMAANVGRPVRRRRLADHGATGRVGERGDGDRGTPGYGTGGRAGIGPLREHCTSASGASGCMCPAPRSSPGRSAQRSGWASVR